jgi:glutamate-1-semialdehyde 2,1-aminomutase
MTMLGKIIGGGLPLAAYGGRADIMKKIAPVGPIYQAGTLSGNPLAVTAGITVLHLLEARSEVYDILAKRTAQLTADMPEGVCANRVGSMFTLFLQHGPVTDYESARKSDTAQFGRLFHFLLDRGIYFPPSQFEAGFLSAAHTEEQVLRTAAVIREFFSGVP